MADERAGIIPQDIHPVRGSTGLNKQYLATLEVFPSDQRLLDYASSERPAPTIIGRFIRKYPLEQQRQFFLSYLSKLRGEFCPPDHEERIKKGEKYEEVYRQIPIPNVENVAAMLAQINSMPTRTGVVSEEYLKTSVEQFLHSNHYPYTLEQVTIRTILNDWDTAFETLNQVEEAWDNETSQFGIYKTWKNMVAASQAAGIGEIANSIISDRIALPLSHGVILDVFRGEKDKVPSKVKTMAYRMARTLYLAPYYEAVRHVNSEYAADGNPIDLFVRITRPAIVPIGFVEARREFIFFCPPAARAA